MVQYLPVLALFVLALLFAALSFVATRILVPRRPTAEKLAPYECGMTPGRDLPGRFPVRFYLVAMLFIIFDIEIVFLYPWAMQYRELGLFGLVSVLIFSALVFESFVYLIAKGALEWGPVQAQRRVSVVDPNRTVSSTVRRVGTEGRLAVVAPIDDPVSSEVAA